MKSNFETLANEWFKKATTDFRFAKASFHDFDEFYAQMCLLCHDSAEKYLKGFLVYNKIKPEKTHNLLNLLLECEKIDKKFNQFTEKCKTLNEYYTPLKYPSYFPPLEKEDAAQSILAVEQLSKFIKEKI